LNLPLKKAEIFDDLNKNNQFNKSRPLTILRI